MFLPLPNLDVSRIPLVGAAAFLKAEVAPMELSPGSSLRAAHAGEDLFVAVRGAAADDAISRATIGCYSDALTLASDLGYRHIVRIWNVVPQINSYCDGIEIYQHFCSGRRTAFSRFDIDEDRYPAASAVGSPGGPLFFAFLFSKYPAQKISNPHQVEAYRYPEKYGPTPPSFARAAVHREKLYLSGTASIRGHETLFEDDLEMQVTLTLENIDDVLASARRTSGQNFELATMDLRVYLRHPSMIGSVRERLAPCRSSRGRTDFLQADICRRDLLVEIEGVADARA